MGQRFCCRLCQLILFKKKRVILSSGRLNTTTDASLFVWFTKMLFSVPFLLSSKMLHPNPMPLLQWPWYLSAISMHKRMPVEPARKRLQYFVPATKSSHWLQVMESWSSPAAVLMIWYVRFVFFRLTVKLFCATSELLQQINSNIMTGFFFTF